mgnify:CR=1 FL=1
MGDVNIWTYAGNLIFYGVASFFAIAVWGRTREISWLFVIIGILSLYISIILSMLDVLGAVNLDSIMIGQSSPLRILVEGLPAVFFIIACIAYLRRRI